MQIIREYREKASALRAEARHATMSADCCSKLAAARKFETIAREIEVVVGPNGESRIEEWLD